MMRSQTCSISFSSWLTTRSPIFRSFTSASRKFQIWLWVMGSNMVLISSAIRNRVLSPEPSLCRTAAVLLRKVRPDTGYTSPLNPESLYHTFADRISSCRTACIRTRGLTACSGCCQIICTGQQPLPEAAYRPHRRVQSSACGSPPESDRASSYQSRSARRFPAGQYSPVPDSHPTAPLCCPRIFIADMFRFQSHRTFLLSP